jgi:hypothetical protein
MRSTITAVWRNTRRRTALGTFPHLGHVQISEFERDLIRERRDGLAATTARGRNGGPQGSADRGAEGDRPQASGDGHSIGEIGQLLGNGKPVSRRRSTGPWECSRRSRSGVWWQTQRTSQLRKRA